MPGSLFCKYRKNVGDMNPFVVMSFKGQAKKGMSGLAIKEPWGKDALRRQWSILNPVCRRSGTLEVIERPSLGGKRNDHCEICDCFPKWKFMACVYRWGLVIFLQVPACTPFNNYCMLDIASM